MIYGYRKYSACLLGMALASGLCYMGKIGDQVYATVMLAVVGAYITGNVASKKVAPSAPEA